MCRPLQGLQTDSNRLLITNIGDSPVIHKCGGISQFSFTRSWALTSQGGTLLCQRNCKMVRIYSHILRPNHDRTNLWRHNGMISVQWPRSILHRASAITSFIALILVSIGLVILAFTGKLPLEGLIFSPLGAFGFFIFTFGFIFIALAQLRHAIWDKGAMMEPDKNNILSYVMIFASIILAFAATFIATGAL